MGIGRKVSSSHSSGPSSHCHAGSGVATHRASYPSGQWLDDDGRPARSPNADYSTSSEPKKKEKTKTKLPNPDPNNFKIVKAESVGRFLVLKINYPDCTNYEGNKILVFEGITPIDLLNQKIIDPHFFEGNAKCTSPIARFVPTVQGWKMAVDFVNMLNSKKG